MGILLLPYNIKLHAFWVLVKKRKILEIDSLFSHLTLHSNITTIPSVNFQFCNIFFLIRKLHYMNFSLLQSFESLVGTFPPVPMNSWGFQPGSVNAGLSMLNLEMS